VGTATHPHPAVAERLASTKQEMCQYRKKRVVKPVYILTFCQSVHEPGGIAMFVHAFSFNCCAKIATVFDNSAMLSCSCASLDGAPTQASCTA
jgi:hypothetical protein